ncbi:hypothetical protein AVEN_10019-1 [Araneus ventricosus]|uniref:Uncharacterized protein n=1 Tax=Araneus ventricosus TaxID=182803 RepID=A0A4Y2H3Y6_ARAVE|nr:hypothetical protein AVEN_10019-1 [Araneus ventricosus]
MDMGICNPLGSEFGVTGVNVDVLPCLIPLGYWWAQALIPKEYKALLVFLWKAFFLLLDHQKKQSIIVVRWQHRAPGTHPHQKASIHRSQGKDEKSDYSHRISAFKRKREGGGEIRTVALSKPPSDQERLFLLGQRNAEREWRDKNSGFSKPPLDSGRLSHDHDNNPRPPTHPLGLESTRMDGSHPCRSDKDGGCLMLEVCISVLSQEKDEMSAYSY